MSFGRFVTLLAGLSVHVLASPLRDGTLGKRVAPESHVLHERGLPQWEQTWQQGERLPSNVVLPMRFGLRQSNMKDGHDMLMDM